MSDLSAWRKALTGEPIPLHENDPQEGYWRLRQRRSGAWLPIAIWREPDGSLKALREGEEADPQELWTWCCRHPVPYETYVAVAERGEAWPDEVPEPRDGGEGSVAVPLTAAQPIRERWVGHGVDGAAGSSDTASGERSLPGLGHNSGAVDPAGGLLGEILALRQTATDWLAVASPLTEQVEADRAANFAERFGALEKQAEAARVAAKAPILEAGRVIDAAWKPVIAEAASGKSLMKRALEPFLAGERERRETLHQAGLLAAEEVVARAGTQGRRIGLRRQRRLVVRDRDALVRHYRRDPRFWAHEGISAVLAELAEADLKAGRAVPGADLVDSHIAA